MSGHKNDPPRSTESFSEPTPGLTVGETIPVADYSRWMTENWEQIADLNLGLLALVSTHNAGADLKSMWGWEELTAACQDDTFEYQLKEGVRCFDLRIRDDSWKKLVSSNNVQLIEKMSFHHTFSTGRYLQDCVATMRAFALANPLELLILSIEEYIPSKYSGSIEMCHRYLAPLNNLLIPQTQGNLTLRELRQNLWGKNIIIAAPRSLLPGNPNYWPPFEKRWAGGDASLSRLKEFTRETFNNIREGHATALEGAWTFDAQARDEYGAMRLKSDGDYFRDFFDPDKKIGKYVNIVKADFIADTGLVPFCISLNKERGKLYPAPLPPTELKAVQIDQTEQVSLTWTAPKNAPVLRYDVSVNGEIELTPYSPSGILQSVPPGLHTIKVRTVDTRGRRSTYGPELKLQVIDIAPPTTPGKLRLTEIGMNSARLVWNESYDYSGIKRYRIMRNGHPYSYTTKLSEPVSVVDHAAYKFEVLAEDNNELWSKPAAIIFTARPLPPVSPSFTLDEPDWSPGKHRGVLTWKEPHPSEQDYDYQVKLAPDQVFYVAKSALSYWMLVDEGKAYTVEIRVRFRGRDELSAPLIYTFTGDTVAPGEVTNLKAEDIDETSATLTWSPAPGSVGEYAILLNDDVPIFVPASPCRYTTHKLVSGKDNICEVWAVNPNGIPGLSAAITIGKVLPTPQNVNFRHLGGIGTLTWTPVSDVEITYEIDVNGADVSEGQGTSMANFRLSDVPPGPLYNMKIRARKGAYFSDYVILAETVADGARPGSPSGLVANNVTETSAVVSWSPSSSVQPLRGYRVSINGLYLGIVTGTSYTFPTLMSGVFHAVFVRAQDVSGNLSVGVGVGFRTLGNPPLPPPVKPENLRMTAQTSDSVSLAWSQPQGEGTAIGYRIVCNDERFNNIAIDPEKTITGLTFGLKYHFWVYGVDILGQISEPAEISLIPRFSSQSSPP